MFNTAFKLREQKGYCTPKEPDFNRAKTIKLDFDGTKIQLKLPRHNSAKTSFDALYSKVLTGMNK